MCGIFAFALLVHIVIAPLYTYNNNNNKNIETFINEMSPIIDKLKKENSFAAILGDFNINLLQINEREKYEDFFDMMCTNNFYPKIMFPTRIAARSHSLLDQTFCKVPCKDKSWYICFNTSKRYLRSFPLCC